MHLVTLTSGVAPVEIFSLPCGCSSEGLDKYQNSGTPKSKCSKSGRDFVHPKCRNPGKLEHFIYIKVVNGTNGPV